MVIPKIFAFAALALAAPSSRLHRRQAPAGVPEYVTKYAPVIHLYSGENYDPADIGAQLTNTVPKLNFTTITNGPDPLTLDNLNALNDLGGETVYLTSKDNVKTNPVWLFGVKPDGSGKTDGAVSCAIIVNDHGSGLVDAFYMYFYAFDFGGIYFGHNIGNHVGDWEHTMVRFQDGVPQAVWYSQHSNGEAFTYNTTMKYDEVRPLVYVANGTHANYAIPGIHGHGIPDINLPYGPINDYTDSGVLWDPTLSAYYVSYDVNSNNFTAYDDSTPVNWLYFIGRWGDEQYPDSDPRQETVLGIDGLSKYTSGPTGPIDKQLNRTEVCPDNGNLCIVRAILGP